MNQLPLELPQALVFDLDGTLTDSKSPITDSMVQTLSKLLQYTYIVIISGASYHQFETQVVQKFPSSVESDRLLLFPENGSEMYVNGVRKYEEKFSDEEAAKIIEALEKMAEHFGLPMTGEYGEMIENRGGQVTFSALGQQAPLEKKKVWDPDEKKRIEMKKYLDELLSDASGKSAFEIRIGGATSIDITRPGITKAYAIEKLLEFLKLTKKDLLFYGDAIFPGGNDEIVEKIGVPSQKVDSYQHTERLLFDILTQYEEASRKAAVGGISPINS